MVFPDVRFSSLADSISSPDPPLWTRLSAYDRSLLSAQCNCARFPVMAPTGGLVPRFKIYTFLSFAWKGMILLRMKESFVLPTFGLRRGELSGFLTDKCYPFRISVPCTVLIGFFSFRRLYGSKSVCPWTPFPSYGYPPAPVRIAFFLVQRERVLQTPSFTWFALQLPPFLLVMISLSLISVVFFFLRDYRLSALPPRQFSFFFSWTPPFYSL